MEENKNEIDDQFCPKCKSILKPKEVVNTEGRKTKKLHLVCEDCGYNKEASHFSTTHYSTRMKTDGSLHMDPARIQDLIYDKTLPHTSCVPCTNNECPSKKSKQNPEVVLLKFENHLELGYLCSVCKYIWGRY
jgi:DNA-directed RNA polymerase subunit M/transcription elongation factor TFIIS